MPLLEPSILATHPTEELKSPYQPRHNHSANKPMKKLSITDSALAKGGCRDSGSTDEHLVPQPGARAWSAFTAATISLPQLDRMDACSVTAVGHALRLWYRLRCSGHRGRPRAARRPIAGLRTALELQGWVASVVHRSEAIAGRLPPQLPQSSYMAR